MKDDPLDPRMVSPETLLHKLGRRRPGISVVVPAATHPTTGTSGEAGLAGLLPDARVQILADVPGSQARATAARINELARGALAPILVLLPSTTWSPSELRAALRNLRDDKEIGSISFGASGDGLVTRSSVWAAFGGLDPDLSIAPALNDYNRRAAGIGYRVIGGLSLQVDGGRGRSRPVKSLTIYTAITQDYDSLKPLPEHLLEGCTPIAFVDARSRPTSAARYRGWTLVETTFPGRDAARQSRYPKINSHIVLPDSEVSLWVDASIGITCPYPLVDMAGQFLKDADICVFRHHERKSVAEEAAACKAHALDSPSLIDAQMARYALAGFPDASGLAEVPVLLRRHAPPVAALNEAWWDEIERGSRRDQLSFPFVLWRMKIDTAVFPGTLQDRNGLFVKYRRDRSHRPG